MQGKSTTSDDAADDMQHEHQPYHAIFSPNHSSPSSDLAITAAFPATSAHVIGFTSLYAQAVPVRLHVVSELGAGESSWWTGLTDRAAEVRFLSQYTEGIQKKRMQQWYRIDSNCETFSLKKSK